MAFCTNCGRKLNPGEICICQQQKGAVNGQKADTGGSDAPAGSRSADTGWSDAPAGNGTADTI